MQERMSEDAARHRQTAVSLCYGVFLLLAGVVKHKKVDATAAKSPTGQIYIFQNYYVLKVPYYVFTSLLPRPVSI